MPKEPPKETPKRQIPQEISENLKTLRNEWRSKMLRNGRMFDLARGTIIVLGGAIAVTSLITKTYPAWDLTIVTVIFGALVSISSGYLAANHPRNRKRNYEKGLNALQDAEDKWWNDNEDEKFRTAIGKARNDIQNRKVIIDGHH